MTTAPKRVVLWTVPCSVSTAFERAFMQVDGARVVHEPYGGPYYFGPERRSQRFGSDEVDPTQRYADVTRELLAVHDGETTVFSKDMAFYVNPEEVLEFLSASRSSFLIRDPRKAIPSLHRLSLSSEENGWVGFDGVEAGFEAIHDLFRFTVDELHQSPVVVDAEDLLADPPGVLAAYCEAVGVAFSETMLEWQAERVPDWDVGQGGHEDLQGPTPFRRSDGARVIVPTEIHPPEVEAAIQAALPHYEALYRHRLCP